MGILKHMLLEERAFRHHFFMVATNQDNFEFPDWLMEHPLLLKLFCINVRRNQTHPKLVILPLGIHPTHFRSATELVFARTRGSIRVMEQLLYARFASRATRERWRAGRAFPPISPQSTPSFSTGVPFAQCNSLGNRDYFPGTPI